MLKQKICKRFEIEQDACRTSDDRYFIDDFTGREPDIGMWDVDAAIDNAWIIGAKNIAIGVNNTGIVCTVNVCTGTGNAWSLSHTVADDRITTTFNQEEQTNLISDLSEKEDCFTQTDLLDTEDYQVQELILRFRTLPSITYQERLVDRLFTLFNDAREEDPASPGIAVGSLRNFYSFFQLQTKLKRPIISLTPDDNIYASWRSEQNSVFSVHFLPTNEDVRFVILKPNNMHSKKQIRHSGTATIDTLMKEVESSNVRDWILE